MIRQRWIAALVVVTGLSALGMNMLTADEPGAPRPQRVSPKLLKEAMIERPVTTATAAHTIGRSMQDLRSVADDLEKAGQKSEAGRLNAAIREIVRRAEHEMADKKSQIAKLNAEIDELKWAIGQ